MSPVLAGTGALLLLAACASRSEIDAFLGKRIVDVLKEPDRVRTFRLDGSLDTRGTGEERVGEYRVMAVGPELSADQVAELRALVFDPENWDFRSSKACAFLPGVAFRFEKATTTVDVLLCFTCDEWGFAHEESMAVEDFDPARAQLLDLSRTLFPGDSGLEAAAHDGPIRRPGQDAATESEEHEAVSNKKYLDLPKTLDVVFLKGTTLTPEDYSAEELMGFDGISSRTTAHLVAPILIAEFVVSSENEERIDGLLSSLSIPFQMGLTPFGTRKNEHALGVLVSKDDYQAAASVLRAAVGAGLVEETGLVKAIRGRPRPTDGLEEYDLDPRPELRDALKTIDIEFIESTQLTPERYSIDALMAYDGLSSRTKEIPREPVSIIGFEGSLDNINSIDTLLSSKSIPFLVKKYNAGAWKDQGIRVIVPKEWYQITASVLEAGVDAGVVKEAE